MKPGESAKVVLVDDHRMFHESIRTLLGSENDIHVVGDGLTIREIDILHMLHQGLRNAEIAEQPGPSVRTVEVHVRNVRSKLGTKNRTGAVRLASDMN